MSEIIDGEVARLLAVMDPNAANTETALAYEFRLLRECIFNSRQQLLKFQLYVTSDTNLKTWRCGDMKVYVARTQILLPQNLTGICS